MLLVNLKLYIILTKSKDTVSVMSVHCEQGRQAILSKKYLKCALLFFSKTCCMLNFYIVYIVYVFTLVLSASLVNMCTYHLLKWWSREPSLDEAKTVTLSLMQIAMVDHTWSWHDDDSCSCLFLRFTLTWT